MPGELPNPGELATHVAEGARFVGGKATEAAKAVVNSVVDDANTLVDAKAPPMARFVAAADLAADVTSVVAGPEDAVAERLAVKGIEQTVEHAPVALRGATETGQQLKKFFVDEKIWHREHVDGFFETHHRFYRTVGQVGTRSERTEQRELVHFFRGKAGEKPLSLVGNVDPDDQVYFHAMSYDHISNFDMLKARHYELEHGLHRSVERFADHFDKSGRMGETVARVKWVPTVTEKLGIAAAQAVGTGLGTGLAAVGVAEGIHDLRAAETKAHQPPHRADEKTLRHDRETECLPTLHELRRKSQGGYAQEPREPQAAPVPTRNKVRDSGLGR